MNKAPKNVNAYITGMSKEVRGILTKLRRVIMKAAPKASERISYRMPTYMYGGSGYKGWLISFAAFKKHVSIFISPSQRRELPRGLEKYRATKASFHFALEEPLPTALIRKTVKVIFKRLVKAGIKRNEARAKNNHF